VDYRGEETCGLTNTTLEMLRSKEVVEQDREKALRALMLNHLVHGRYTAQATLKRSGSSKG
jgi:hypothetical protein